MDEECEDDTCDEIAAQFAERVRLCVNLFAGFSLEELDRLSKSLSRFIVSFDGCI